MFNPTLRAVLEQIYQVDRPWIVHSSRFGQQFGWKGDATARLNPCDGDVVQGICSEESCEGLPVRLMRGSRQRRLQTALTAGVEALKAASERRAGR